MSFQLAFVNDYSSIMASSIFIENLHPDVDVLKLCEIFGKYGRILSAYIEIDKKLGSLCKGCICYDNSSSAFMAVKELNGKNNRGRPLYIKGEKKCNYSAAEEHYKKIYVKNMDLNWDNSDLIEEFEIFGEIEEAKISMTDGKSKGFGFVKFYNHSSAKKAIEVMHGKFINNKQLIVEPFTYKENSKSSDDSVKKQYNSFQLNNLFIKNLPKNMVEIELSDLFKKFGAIQSVRVATDSENKSKGYGFVCFSNKEIAAKARDQMNGMSYKSQILEVDFYKKKSNYVSSSRHSNNKINMFDQEIKSSTPSFRTRKNTIFSFSG